MLTRATAANPGLLAIKGIGPVLGAQLLITAGDNPDRLRTAASFAALCGTAPIPVSSGRTDRHRLSRGGDPMSPSPDARPSVIYECPECETRYLNERRGPDCQLFTRRIGPGGTCPHCDEPVAQVDLI